MTGDSRDDDGRRGPTFPPLIVEDGVNEPAARRAFPLWFTVVLGMAGTAVALWGIHVAAPLLAPVVLALVLTIVVHPLIGALVRRGMRRAVAIALAVLLVDGGLIAVALILVVSIGQLATVLPTYSDEWQQLLDGLRATLVGLGVGPEQVQQALRSIEPRTVVGALRGVLSGVADAFFSLFLVVATVVFATAESAGMPERLALAPGTARLQEALGAFARNTRRYVVVTTVFGFAVAVVDTIALVALGIPLALLWGLVSFLTNYIPNIGFFLGLAPPTILALLVGGPGTALLVVVIYIVVNFILQSVVQPVVVGDVVGLSVTLTFLSVFLWTFVLGPLGALLAIPLSLFVHAVLVGQDPGRRWARTLLAGASGADRADRRPAGSRASATTRWPRGRRAAAPVPAATAPRTDGEPSGGPPPAPRGHD